MAEGFEPYHVPQQSRRDKLRVNNQPGCVDYFQGCAPLVPLYDPSLISSDLISCAANLHRQSFNLDVHTSVTTGGKEDGMNLMVFAGGMNMISPAAASSSTPTNHHVYSDPQLSVQSNPSTIQDINGSQYVYTSPHNYRAVLDQSFHSNAVVAYKPESLSMAHHEPNSNSAASSGQSLSLSLSSHHTQNTNLPLELNLQRYDSSMFSNSNKVSEGYFVAGNGGSTSIELSRSSVPLGPFTGYASVLKKSRFLKPAQQLLEEVCDAGRGVYAEKIAPDSSLLDPSLESLSGTELVDESLNFSGGTEQTRKKSRLLSMLDEVYKRYKLYYQQMQAVVSSFESVAGLSNAAPFASLALKSLSKHFKCLKNTITEQLLFTIKYHGKVNYERDETQRLDNSGMGQHGQRLYHHNTRFVDQPVWRPQRGLPERAVCVLRAWLFEHFLHPYPTDTDKLMLAKQTGLSRNQVSNWFINARVRLWKPMVEEIHMLETRQSQKHPHKEEPSGNRLNDNMPTSSSVECENAPTSFQGIGEFTLKRSRDELIETPGESNEPMNLPYQNLSHHPHLGAGVGSSGGSGGVSLTLGLHQNGMGLSEPYPMNAARRFGLDAHGEGYMLSGYATQDRQYGRDIIG